MPRVVLPEPDSPTIPTVSPARSARLTPATALKTLCLNQPSETAERDAHVARLQHRRRRRIDRGDLPLGAAVQQADGVGMLRLRENGFSRTALHQLAVLHDADPMRKAAHQCADRG